MSSEKKVYVVLGTPIDDGTRCHGYFTSLSEAKAYVSIMKKRYAAALSLFGEPFKIYEAVNRDGAAGKTSTFEYVYKVVIRRSITDKSGFVEYINDSDSIFVGSAPKERVAQIKLDDPEISYRIVLATPDAKRAIEIARRITEDFLVKGDGVIRKEDIPRIGLGKYDKMVQESKRRNGAEDIDNAATE